ncbi:MAG TPA: DUF4340 domain-containing protein [Flavipsychrobacter sp.]|nr:DUF4340 domain-containing protein [Flavipsychrobacter sp.]
MGRTLLYLVLLVALGFGVYYFVFKDKANPYGIDQAGFTIKDTADIGKIFIASYNNSSVLVERTDSGWYVNKQYKALPSTLNQLLQTLWMQQPLYPVPEKMRNNVIKDMAGTSIKVELYNRGGKKIRTFYVGNEANSSSGTFMLIDGANSPYVVNIPGFQGFLTSRYTSDLKDWRDRTVFNVSPDQLRSVTIQYPEHPINSFTLKQENGKIVVDADTNIVNHNKFNDRRAHVYLKFFQNINCEGYLNGFAGIDTLLKIMPKRCTIDVTDKKGHQTHVDIYWMPVNKRSKNLTASDPNIPDNYDADRFYAVMNNGKDTAMVQEYVFQKIFRNAYEFYEPDEQSSDNQVKPREPLAPIYKRQTVPYYKKKP